MKNTKVIDSYDFDMDAMGFGPFISDNVAALPDDEMTVYVEDDQGHMATSAIFVRETLTDGSTVVNLIITFDRA